MTTDEDVIAQPGARALRALLVSMMLTCTRDSSSAWKQRVCIIGLAEQCSPDGHLCMHDDDPEVRHLYRIEIMRALSTGLVADVKRNEWTGQIGRIIDAASSLTGMDRHGGIELFCTELLAQLRTGVTPDRRSAFLTSSVAAGKGGQKFMTTILALASEANIQSPVFVESLRDAVLHEFSAGGLSEPGSHTGGNEFTAIVNEALMSARIGADDLRAPITTLAPVKARRAHI